MSGVDLSGVSLIVLNDDTIVCEGCYELNAPSETMPDVDLGKWPFGRTETGACSNCGAVGAGGEKPTARQPLRGQFVT